jgi:hypothetical protein
VGLEVFVLGTHLAELRAKIVEDFLERAVFRQRRGFFFLFRRSGWGRCLRVGRRERVEAKIVELFGEVGEKLVGGKAGSSRGGLGREDSIRFGFWDGDGSLRRLLVVGGNEWFGLEDQLEILVELEFGFASGGRRKGRLFGSCRLFRDGGGPLRDRCGDVFRFMNGRKLCRYVRKGIWGWSYLG